MAEASDKGSIEQANGDGANAPDDTIVQSASLYLMARRALVASLGAVAITIDESNDFLSRLVDRGEVAETDIARLVNDYVSRSKSREEKEAVKRRAPMDRATVALAESVEVILERLNVPTRADIEELSHKISLLNEKVITLKQKGLTMQHGTSGTIAPALEVEGPDHLRTSRDG